MTTKMIRAGFAFAALLVAPIVAQAADLPPSLKAPAYTAPAYASWSGFYVGLNAAYGFGKSTWDFPAVTPAPKGALFGVTLGYNFQTGTWVWGIETDLDWSGMKGSATCPGGTCSTENNWLGTTRARLGYGGWGNWLPYVTVGAAYGGVKAVNAVGASASHTQIGWTAGLGLEYAFSGAWSAKVEWLYADLGKFDCGATCGATTPDDVSFKANLIRVGVNYRF